jgi:hypothetical protein
MLVSTLPKMNRVKNGCTRTCSRNGSISRQVTKMSRHSTDPKVRNEIASAARGGAVAVVIATPVRSGG